MNNSFGSKKYEDRYVLEDSVTVVNRSKLTKKLKGALYKLYVMVGESHICLDKCVI